MQKIFLLVISICLISSGYPQSARHISPLQAYNITRGKPAIDGYDPVSYFTKNQAVKGKSNLTATHQGIVYQFENETNRQAFLKQPQKYEPQYGGWCAYAMGATGEKVEVDPETFKIVDGRLYLFYNKFFNNTLKSWNKDEAALMKKADQNWLKLFPSTKS